LIARLTCGTRHGCVLAGACRLAAHAGRTGVRRLAHDRGIETALGGVAAIHRTGEPVVAIDWRPRLGLAYTLGGAGYDIDRALVAVIAERLAVREARADQIAVGLVGRQGVGVDGDGVPVARIAGREVADLNLGRLGRCGPTDDQHCREQGGESEVFIG